MSPAQGKGDGVVEFVLGRGQMSGSLRPDGQWTRCRTDEHRTRRDPL